MRFSPARFNGFLSGDVRQEFLWRRASKCPCVADHSGQPKPGCPLCEGKGLQWAPPLAAHAGMTGLSSKKAMEQFGSYEAGDATLTIPSSSPMYIAGRGDRITALGATNPFSIVLRRGLNDKLLGRIVSVDRVFWLTPDGTANVEGAIPTVNADGSLSWVTGAPPPRVNFTVEGVRHDELYIFTELPADRNAGVSGNPRRAPVRLFDLFAR